MGLKIINAVTICLIFVFINLPTNAQSLISSSGNFIKTETLSIEWSLGEFAINTLSSETIVLTQGFHQPVLTTVNNDYINENFKIRVYPNPASEFIYIQVDGFNSLSIKLISSLGKVMKEKNIERNLLKISTENMISGLYYLNIYKNNILITTQKISIVK